MATKVIGIADLNIVRAPDKISTIGLGSCCGVVLFEKRTKIAGMVHILLPKSTEVNDASNKAKFADTGIRLLHQRITDAIKPLKPVLVAKMAGGAHMFGGVMNKSSSLNVGERNVKSCKETLLMLHIPLVAEDTLGTYGRTIIYDPATDQLLIKTAGHGEKII